MTAHIDMRIDLPRTDAAIGGANAMHREATPAEAETEGECAPASLGDSALGGFDHLDRLIRARLAAATLGLSPTSALLASMDWASHVAMAPGKMTSLAVLAVREMLDGSPDDVTDPRFAAPNWAQWPFCAYRDAFLRTQAWWNQATTGVRGVDPHNEHLVEFCARQWLDCWSPSNFIATNPAVLMAIAESGGANLVAGAQRWLDDLREAGARLAGEPPPLPSEFRVGESLAVTSGKVVWRNALCELLQYTPATPRVGYEPVFITPSWIMKYYVLDLQPHNSLIRYLVEQGHTVFVISWKNPRGDARDLRLNDYLAHGLLAALREVRARCDDAPVHAVGYCLGGTLLAIAAAVLARDGHADALRSVTLLAAQTDFQEPGELGLFIDASQLAALDALMWEQGYLDGSQMAGAFQLLKARDLFWSRMMSEYLLGRRSTPTDLMTWNADTTRMPYRMHSEYLHALFFRNDLAGGKYCVDDHPVALSDIMTPTFVVATERDHVSPWRSVYKLHLLTHNALTFLLTSGGHNAGIVSEPGHRNRHYRVATRPPGAPYRSRPAFLAGTKPTDGSWWPCWVAWLREHTNGEVAAREIGAALQDAPGSYVLER